MAQKLKEIENKYKSELEKAWTRRDDNRVNQSTISIEILPDENVMSQSFSMRPAHKRIESLGEP